MPTVKGYCINCKNASDAERVFDVSLESKNCFCPHCLSTHEPYEAVNAYHKVLDSKIEFASKKFLVESDFAAAYQAFADVLTLDHDYVPAHLWRIVSLCCLSTLRKSMFSQANIIFMNEMDMYKKYEDIHTIVTFAVRIMNTCSFYIHNVQRRTSYKNRFYEIECIVLYYERVKDVLSLLSSVDTLLDSFKDQTANHNYIHIRKSIKDKIKEYQSVLEHEFALLNGDIYKLARFMDEGNAIVSKSGTTSAKRIPPSVVATLNQTDRSKTVIRDDVFSRYGKLHKERKIDTPLSLISFITGIALLVVLFFFLDKPIVWILLTILSGIFMLTSLILLLRIVYCSSKIKKIAKWLF